MSKNKPLPDLTVLIKSATQARKNAYARYSDYQVGAAIRTSDGHIFAGCNVENSSYGATICAERVAIQNAITHRGRFQLTEILVLTDATPPWPPCGMCRQVIAEFASPHLIVHLANPAGEIKTISFEKLFPDAFTSDHLNTSSKEST